MTTTTRLDQIRESALERVARRERAFKLALYGAAAFEAGMLALFFALADLSNRLHVLLLVSSVLIYGTLALGMYAVAAYLNRAVERVLIAVELLVDEQEVGRGGDPLRPHA